MLTYLMMARLLSSIFILLALFSCETPTTFDGLVTLRFQTTNRDFTRATMADYFAKLNVMVFDAQGNRVFDKAKTQTSTDSDFGTMPLKLSDGTYTVVAVGHSSKNSATIKSQEVVQFTASNGEKLTDTFCACQQITVPVDSSTGYIIDMYRAVAMVQFHFTDSVIPDGFERVKIDYTGGSANFNPTTLEGITKSTQSELRLSNEINLYQAFTFPYLSDTGVLKMTVSALDNDGAVIRSRQFNEVPVTRNRITTFSGPFFENGDGQFTQSGFGFLIHADWDGEDIYEF